jgi:glycosyltransferase involved in cell wall biosynthesis
MRNHILVSIITNNYNYGRFLSEAINSALNQTYKNTEVIVVDDGSTDNSRDIIARYGDRIIPVLKQNEGQASACNSGYAVSHGDVIIFLDSDDMLLPTTVEKILPRFQDSNVIKVHWPLWVIDDHGRNTREIYPNYPLCEGDLLEGAIINGPSFIGHSPTSGNAWTRKYLNEVIPIPEWGDKHGVDTYLVTLAPIYGTVKKSPEPLGFYRVHADNYLRGAPEYKKSRLQRRRSYKYKIFNEHLTKMGIMADRKNWMLDFRGTLESLLPRGDRFIIVDEDLYSDIEFSKNLPIPFLERNGEYWGLPNDDDIAITELERLRSQGASFIVFIRPCFWWLDYYKGFALYLRSNFPCILENNLLVVFGLTTDK